MKVLHPYKQALGESSSLSAKIDTGADISVAPVDSVRRLGIRPLGYFYVYDALESQHYLLWSYLVRFVGSNPTTHDKLFEMTAEVIVLPREDALIGRDILEHFMLVADGKNQSFTIDEF